MALGLLALGGAFGLQMKGQYEAGKAAEAQAESEAEWAEYRAKLQEREAAERLEAAAIEEKKHRKAGARLKARQRVLVGQAGILPIGSPFEVMKETATELEMDALMIRRGGMVGAQALTAEAQFSRYAGRSALLRGRSARRASRYDMASTGLMGGAMMLDMYGNGSSRLSSRGRRWGMHSSTRNF